MLSVSLNSSLCLTVPIFIIISSFNLFHVLSLPLFHAIFFFAHNFLHAQIQYFPPKLLIFLGMFFLHLISVKIGIRSWKVCTFLFLGDFREMGTFIDQLRSWKFCWLWWWPQKKRKNEGFCWDTRDIDCSCSEDFTMHFCSWLNCGHGHHVHLLQFHCFLVLFYLAHLYIALSIFLCNVLSYFGIQLSSISYGSSESNFGISNLKVFNY